MQTKVEQVTSARKNHRGIEGKLDNTGAPQDTQKWYGPQDQVLKHAKEMCNVATADVTIYDSIAEAVGAETEARCLEYINAQVRTNSLNVARAQAVVGITASALEGLVMNRIFTTPELLSRVSAAAQIGDQAAMEAIKSEVRSAIKTEKGIMDNGSEEEATA